MKTDNRGRCRQTAVGGCSSASHRGGERRKRTHYTPAQQEVLVQAFEKNPYPTFEDRMGLAEETKKEEPRIHVWFQNRRARQPKSADSRARGNLEVFLRNLLPRGQSRQRRSHAAAVSQFFNNEPSQPGRGWNLSHPMGQYQQVNNFQYCNSSFGTGQMVSLPQSNLGLSSVARGMQSGLGGGNLPMIQQQDQRNTFYQHALPENYSVDQDLQNLRLGEQVYIPHHQSSIPRMDLDKQEGLMHHFHSNQGAVNEENGYTQASQALCSDQVQVEKKPRPSWDNLSYGSRSNMSLGYSSNGTTPSPSAECQEDLQEQFPPIHVRNQPMTEYNPLWSGMGNNQTAKPLQMLLAIDQNQQQVSNYFLSPTQFSNSYPSHTYY